MKLRYLTLLCPLIIFVYLVACSDWNDPASARAQRASNATEDIVIGAVWPWDGHKGSLWQGIELAVDEINQNGGVINNRKLHIVKENDEASLAKGRQIAQKFTENLDMVAVIGHLNSYIALPTSGMYQASGMVYITPGASDFDVVARGYNLVFRTASSNRDIGRHMADYMHAKGYRRIALCYLKDKTSRDLANTYELRAQELGLTIVDRRAYSEGNEDFGQLANLWNQLYQFDAIFLVGNMPHGGNFIRALRQAGVNVPIVTGEGMTSPDLPALGAVAEGVVVPEIYQGDDQRPATHRFAAMFEKRYGHPADTFAAQGYDAVELLAQAIRKAGNTVPADIAQALHDTRNWPGATGDLSFNEQGDIVNRQIAEKVVRNGGFVRLP